MPEMPDSLSLVWGHSVHLAKFPIFLKLCSSPNFHLIHPNFMQGIIIIQSALFWAICQKMQKLWHFEIFLTQDHIQLEFSISPTIFITVYPNFVPTLDTSKFKCLLEYCNEKLASCT